MDLVPLKEISSATASGARAIKMLPAAFCPLYGQLGSRCQRLLLAVTETRAPRPVVNELPRIASTTKLLQQRVCCKQDAVKGVLAAVLIYVGESARLIR